MRALFLIIVFGGGDVDNVSGIGDDDDDFVKKFSVSFCSLTTGFCSCCCCF